MRSAATSSQQISNKSSVSKKKIAMKSYYKNLWFAVLYKKEYQKIFLRGLLFNSLVIKILRVNKNCHEKYIKKSLPFGLKFPPLMYEIKVYLYDFENQWSPTLLHFDALRKFKPTACYL